MSINGFFSNCQEVSVSDVMKTEYVQTGVVMLFLNVGVLEIVVICSWSFGKQTRRECKSHNTVNKVIVVFKRGKDNS